MGDDKSPLSPMGGRDRDRDRELLIPVSGGGSAPGDGDEDGDRAASSSASAALSSSGREAFHKVVRSWASKKFMTGCVILFPIAITFYITWWFIHFVDGFFSPIYAQLGINIFGLGFITSVTFIFLIGVFMSSWVGASILSLGEWIIKRMPLVRHIYNASKQISAAISPDQNKQAFKEVVIIRHPRIGEYAFGFITSSVSLQSYSGQEELYCVYVPTNHLYIGDIFMVNSKDVIRPNLSVREGIGNPHSPLDTPFDNLLPNMEMSTFALPNDTRYVCTLFCRDCCIWWYVNAPNFVNPRSTDNSWGQNWSKQKLNRAPCVPVLPVTGSKILIDYYEYNKLYPKHNVLAICHARGSQGSVN